MGSAPSIWDLGACVVVCVVWIASYRLVIMDCGSSNLDLGLWYVDCGLWIWECVVRSV